MTSLINIVRSKYLDAFKSVNGWKVLVVDEHSRGLIYAVLKPGEILEENIIVIDLITERREPHSSYAAIYVLMPTTENVQRIIRDFAPGNMMYSGAHLFFVDPIPEQPLERLFKDIKEEHLKCVRDLYLNFWPIESQAFSLKLPEQFFSLYSPPKSRSALEASRARLDEGIEFMAKMIANVCISLDEYPYIRCYMPSLHEPLGVLKPLEQTSPAPSQTDAPNRWRTNLARGAHARTREEASTDFCTKLLALQVQRILDEYKNQNSTFPKSAEGRSRGTLLITDRTMDTLVPFIHEFSYQAMANDLLPIEDGTKYSYKFQTAAGAHENTTATLSDADEIYTEVRHMYMPDAIKKLNAGFNDFRREHPGFTTEGEVTVNGVKDMLARLPQYQDKHAKYSLHLNMAQECMNIFGRDGLRRLAEIEQDCVTGKGGKNLVDEMVSLLDSKAVENLNKVRIIALYIQSRDGVPDADCRRLFQHGNLSPREQDAILGLKYLGVRVIRVPPNDRDRKQRLTRRNKKPQGNEYDLCLCNPLLLNVLEDHVNGTLDQQTFPYVKDSPTNLSASSSLRSSPVTPTTPTSGSLRSAKPSWHKATPKTGAVVQVRQRVLVFVAGGMTYSEMREAYLYSKSSNRDIIIGSTHVITPEGFMKDMKDLEARALPAESGPGSGQRPFQTFYDEKYFTMDQAPPAPRPQQQPPAKESHGGVLTKHAPPPQMLSSSSNEKSGKRKKRFFH